MHSLRACYFCGAGIECGRADGDAAVHVNAVLMEMGHSVGTELKSLKYVIIFILSGGCCP